MNSKRKGFTLTELVIVMAIIAILGTAGLVVGTKQIARARKTKERRKE